MNPETKAHTIDWCDKFIQDTVKNPGVREKFKAVFWFARQNVGSQLDKAQEMNRVYQDRAEAYYERLPADCREIMEQVDREFKFNHG